MLGDARVLNKRSAKRTPVQLFNACIAVSAVGGFASLQFVPRST